MFTLVMAACFFLPPADTDTVPQVRCVEVEMGEYRKEDECRHNRLIQQAMLEQLTDNIAYFEAACEVKL